MTTRVLAVLSIALAGCGAGETSSDDPPAGDGPCAVDNGGCGPASAWACSTATGAVVCTDRDECAANTDDCAANAICTNSEGAFSCACPSGFTGDGTQCTDVNECATGAASCHADATCTNTAGSFSCACRSGFTGNGTTSCVDVDECAAGTDNCSADATCSNSTGGFTCACVSGFTGNGVTCANIDDCASSTCTGSQRCVDGINTYTCVDPGFSGGLCRGGWCWESPAPQGESIRGLWFAAPDRGFAVGDAGLFMTYDGAAWSIVDAGTDGDLNAVTGTAEDDVFLIGWNGGEVLHWDGMNVAPIGSAGSEIGAQFIGVGAWAAAPDDVYVIGWNYGSTAGRVYRFDGDTWSQIHLAGRLEGIWGADPNNVFMVGPLGTIIHFDGVSTFTSHAQPQTRQFHAVWGTSSTNVFAVGGVQGTGGHRRVIYRLGPSGWAEQVLGSSVGDALYAIWGAGPGSIFAVGEKRWRFNGSSWSPDPDPTAPLYAVHGTSAQHVFAGGSSGAMGWFSGSTWLDNDAVLASANDVWSSGGADLFVVGDGGYVARLNGTSWSTTTLGAATLSSVWGASATDVYAVGSGGVIYHFNGSDWTAQTSNTTDDLLAVWGSGASDIYAVGRGCTVVHSNGSSWTDVTPAAATCNALHGVWGTSSSNVYAVGTAGTALRNDNGTWTSSVVSGAATLHDIHAAGTTLFAVDSDGSVFTNSGSGWSSPYPGAATEALYGVYATSTTDALAVGAEGTMVRLSGSSWAKDPVVTAKHLWAVFARGGSYVVAGAGRGVLREQ